LPTMCLFNAGREVLNFSFIFHITFGVMGEDAASKAQHWINTHVACNWVWRTSRHKFG
jgi:hypothetical protein